jgi:ABC-type microcin C transport system duplicated ATPase subunit YejF
MTITITGERREGKSTLGQALVFLLKTLGYTTEYQDVNQFATNIANREPLNLKLVEPRHVIIKAT